MANLHCTTTSPSVSSYKRNNRLVTEGYDASTCKYWVRFDFGSIFEFFTRDERDQAIERVLAPKADLSLPQLPARAESTMQRKHSEMRRQRALFIIQTHSELKFASQGVIELPPPKATKKTYASLELNNFLHYVEVYFDVFNQITNGPRLTYYALENRQWMLSCAQNNLSNAAFKYAQLAGMGI